MGGKDAAQLEDTLVYLLQPFIYHITPKRFDCTHLPLGLRKQIPSSAAWLRLLSNVWQIRLRPDLNLHLWAFAHEANINILHYSRFHVKNSVPERFKTDRFLAETTL